MAGTKRLAADVRQLQWRAVHRFFGGDTAVGEDGNGTRCVLGQPGGGALGPRAPLGFDDTRLHRLAL